MSKMRLISARGLLLALSVVGAVAWSEPARAYSFHINVSPFPLCLPVTHIGSYCSLSIDAFNVQPAIPFGRIVAVGLNFGPLFKAAYVGGQAWSCTIGGSGSTATCKYTGPKPVPTGFLFPSIAVRIKARPLATKTPVSTSVCAKIAVFFMGLQPTLAQHCINLIVAP
jgi:hypothetical protein